MIPQRMRYKLYNNNTACGVSNFESSSVEMSLAATSGEVESKKNVFHTLHRVKSKDSEIGIYVVV